MTGSSRIRQGGALVLCALIAAGVYGAPDPNQGLRSALALHDFGHVIGFGLVTAVLVFAMPAWLPEGFRGRLLFASLWGGVALGLGIAVELAQAARPGEGDPWDVFRDAGGILCVALGWLAADRASSARMRALLGVVAITLLAALSYPILEALADEALARTQFPILASFESPRELSRFKFDEGAHPNLVSMLDDESQPVSGVQLLLPPGKYPGFGLSYFPRDWRGMRALKLLLVSREPTPVAMTVRLDDADYDYRLDRADRYNQSFVLKPGPNRIEIPLADVAAAPRGRRFDLAHVQLLLVYAVDLAEQREILVGPIVLLR